ncbi:MAG TPA: UvrD-helicase domain-containing protein [Bacteroidota bacterium]|nr:UvrD-helicase domain-containing protein [Bacteroidota bacterium]
MPIVYTPNQERALSTSHHLAVTANAGSGKTRVLVERFVRTLIEGAPLSEVVALTYTEKAASELRRRIADRLADELSRAQNSGETARIEAIRDDFATAFVGTIHAFCARVLREYPVEAGVDAAFTVITGLDAAELLRESATDVLRDVFRGEYPSIARENMMELLRRVEKRRVVQALRRLVDKRDLLERLCTGNGMYCAADDAILSRWDRIIEETLTEDLQSASLLRDLGRLVASAKDTERSGAGRLLTTIRTGTNLRSRAGAFVELAKQVLTDAGTPRKSSLSDSDEVKAEARRVHELRKLVGPLLGPVVAGTVAEHHRALLSDTRLLLRVAGAITSRYDERKQEDGRLDFDDLQLKMRALLQNESVRRQLARRFRYVMVDEFQDTNMLQMEILLPVLDHLSSGNLFIVGDPKQSIYRFRDADVRVFDRAREAISSVAGTSSTVSLRESFRPLRDVAAFVNLLFPQVMKESAGALTYDPLVLARANRAPGRVELILGAGKAETEGLSEQELIARRILDLHATGETVFGAEDRARPMEFRDVGVLLRSRTGLKELEYAFIRNGVPYLVSGGVGYFQTQDVYDVYNYLRFLLNTSDDVALAGILRSPFYCVSDVELFQLAGARKNRTLWETLLQTAPGMPSSSLLRARALLAEDLAIGARLPAPELLARISRRANFAAALSGTVRAEQGAANIDKLLLMARAFESQGFTTLFDFTERLKEQIDAEDREGQAAIESQSNAVRVMTVHAAKGLEFPLVVVPDLQRGFRDDSEPFIDESLGIGLRKATGEEDDAPIAACLIRRARSMTMQEEQRIFYVACTRARDHLILAAGPASRSPKDSWLEWLNQCAEEGGQSLEADALRFRVTTGTYDGRQEISQQTHELVVPILRTLPRQHPPEAQAAQAAPDRRILLDPIPTKGKGEIFSASKIRTYVECPAKYHLRYDLGFPIGTGPFLRTEEHDLRDEEYPAELRGRVFHAVMENAGDLRAPEEQERAIRAAFEREVLLAPEVSSPLIREVSALVRSLLVSNAWSEIAKGSEVKTEYSISAALGEDFITGTIDRLYKATDGIWTVLDYKTDKVSAASIQERAEMYWTQLRFYAVMVGRLFDLQRVRTRILFAAHPEILLERILSSGDLEAEQRSIADSISRIRAGIFPSRDPTCHQCPMSPGPCIPL